MKINSVVVFDIGSTIIHPDFTVLCDWVRNKTGVTCSVKLIEMAFTFTVSRLFHVQSSDNILEEAKIFFSTCEASAFLSEKEMKSLWLDVVESGGVNSWLYKIIDPDAKNVLLELKSLGCYLVAASNSNGTLMEELNAFDLIQYFDNIYDSDIMGVKKPEPLFYTTILQSHPNSFSLHIGDDLIKDFIAASACGFDKTLLYDRANYYVDIPKHVKLEKLSEVVSKLKGLYEIYLGR